MKTLLRLLLAFTAIFIFLISCNKENNETQPKQKNSFEHSLNNKMFTGRNYSMLHRFTAIVNGLNFTGNGIPFNFIPQSPSMNFAGTSGVIGPYIPGGCLISFMGWPETKEFAYVFHYSSSDKIQYIVEYESGLETWIYFTYNSTGKIIKTEVYYNDDNTPELQFYDEYTYNSKGQVIHVYENVINVADANYYYSYNSNGEAIKMTSDFYDAQETYQYNNGNVIKIVLQLTYGGQVYTETTTYQYDNQNNFWRPLNIPQPFFTFFAWMVSKNNITKSLHIDIEGNFDEMRYTPYTYNSEGYPATMGLDDYYGQPIPFEYINCGK